MSNKFSFDTIDDFDRHIQLSIPNYLHIHELICSMSSSFIKPGTNVFDLGTSTGSLVNKLSYHNRYIKDVTYFGIDKSDNLLPEDREPLNNIKFLKEDITGDWTFINVSLITSIFTLQFIPVNDRIKILENIYKSLNPDGAVIICEKVFLKDGFMQDLFTFSYYDYKKKSFTEKEILDKQRDLREIMRPLTEEQNKTLFRDIGFKNIETFFSSLFFKGWILCK